MKNSFAATFAILGIITLTGAAACSSDPAPANNPSSSSSGDSGVDGSSSSGGQDSAAPPVSDKVVLTTETITVDTTQYEYLLVKPKTYDDRKEYPLIMAFHGDGGNGADMRGRFPVDTYSVDDAIIVYPSRGGNTEWDLSTKYEENPDQKLAQAIVTQLSAKLKIATARVFGVGYSKGGFLINMIACRHEKLFRALITYEAGEPDESSGDDRATQWPSGRTKCFNQTAAGMAIMTFQDPNDGVGSGESTATYWALINGCDENATIASQPVQCKKHANCPADKPVVYCKVEGVGHQVWQDGVKPAWDFLKPL